MSIAPTQSWVEAILELSFITDGDALVARRCARLAGEPDDSLATGLLALAIRAVRDGSTALDPHEIDRFQPYETGDASAATGTSVGAEATPHLSQLLNAPSGAGLAEEVAGSALARFGVVRVEFGLIYLERYWLDEVLIASQLTARTSSSFAAGEATDVEAGLAAIEDAQLDETQRDAVEHVLKHGVTILTGGPGMGKTHTLARAIEALLTAHAPGLRLALAAPTGKAAARMTESLREAHVEVDTDAVTLHRLLGFNPRNHQRFVHNRHNPLPHDVVIVDETSMVSLSMMARLLEALKPSARLLLVGDPDQLASVEAGSVLGDLVAGLPAGVIKLTKHHRLTDGRVALAQAFEAQDPEAVLAAIDQPDDGVSFISTQLPDVSDIPYVITAAGRLREVALSGDADAAIAQLGAFRLLCAHRSGPFGTARWNRLIEAELAESAPEIPHQPMYVGRPILVTKNDPSLGLFNGDTGVIIARDGQLIAAMETSSGVREFSPWRLGNIDTMHAMTVHKAQGSQADAVTVIVPPLDSRLLTREMLYTAVTRAKGHLTVIGDPQAVRAAVKTPLQRASGLRQRLEHLSGQ